MNVSTRIEADDEKDETRSAVADVLQSGDVILFIVDEGEESLFVVMTSKEAREWAAEIIKTIDAATGGGP